MPCQPILIRMVALRGGNDLELRAFEGVVVAAVLEPLPIAGLTFTR
jgi:hypothetical protein